LIFLKKKKKKEIIIRMSAPATEFKKISGKAQIKAVPSGDTVVLVLPQPQNAQGPPPEKELTLSHISAPRLARKDGKDEV
jgi:hypothetical protein